MYQAPFERVDHLGIEHALDIHWRIANPQVVSQVLTHDELVERSVTVRVQGHRCACPRLWMRCSWPASIASLTTLISRSRSGSRTSTCWRRVSSRPSGGRSSSARRADRFAPSACDGLQQAQARFQTQIPLEVLTSLGRGEGRTPRRSSFARACVPSIAWRRICRALRPARRGAARAGASVSARRLHAGRLWLQTAARCCRSTTRRVCGLGCSSGCGPPDVVVGGDGSPTTDHEPPTIQLPRRRDSGSRTRSAARSSTCCARRPRG